jgi:Leucine-rich repeat (LRR) protein
MKRILIISAFLPLSAFAMEMPSKKQKLEKKVQAKSIADLSQQLIKERRKNNILNLSGLGLTSLDALSWVPELHTITELNLSHNHLTWIPNNAFAGMTKLQTLLLSDNQIIIVDPLAFQGLPNLILIDLDKNKLQKITVQFAHLKNLTHLFLEDNNISFIAPYAFRDLTQLTKLLLGFNNLASIDPKALIDIEQSQPGLVNLHILNLEKNPLVKNPQETEKITATLPYTTVLFD